MTLRTDESPSTPEDAPRPPAATEGTASPDASPGDRLVEEDLLVEDVSIDGMCGVY
jgi:mycofactocin precursor